MSQYLNKLSEEELNDVLSIYSDESFRGITHISEEDSYWIIESLASLYDYEEDVRFIISEEYIIDDYSGEPVKHVNYKLRECDIEFRKYMLDKFGNQYAIDYLLYL